ncbi:putative FMN-binding domain-containing protein [Lipomyces doorenjongii]
MYLSTYHAESNLPVLRQFVRENPLGILTTAISSSHPLLQSSHIPWILDVEDNDSETELGRLRGHIARQIHRPKPSSNPSPLNQPVLVLFNGPVHHYVTPKFYTETKPTSGKVVPTSDYSAVQVYGAARIYFDTRSKEFSDFLSQQLSGLSLHAETSIMGYGGEDGPRSWEVSDAPSVYIDLLKKNIIGTEIQIESMTGKFKMSQEKIKGDRDGVIKGFESLNSEVGAQMAIAVRERAALFEAKKEGKRLS